MKNLYKFKWDCKRQGYIEGLFISEEKEVMLAEGKEAYFGEILGKHSDVYGTLEGGDVVKIDISKETLEELESIFGCDISGYNPLNYIRSVCSRCEEGFSPDECEFYFIDGDTVCCNCATEEERKLYGVS